MEIASLKEKIEATDKELEYKDEEMKSVSNIISKDKNQVILTAIDGSFLDQMNENLKQFKRINL